MAHVTLQANWASVITSGMADRNTPNSLSKVQSVNTPFQHVNKITHPSPFNWIFCVEFVFSIKMRYSCLFVTSTTLQLACTVSAWGTIGHDTVALIAQNFVSANTTAFAQKILSDTSSTYLQSVANWADSYRETTAGKFSAPFHFIDAEDNPPHTCSVDFQRDCGAAGCVVSAITNYVRASMPMIPSFFVY
jgi:hypothetical protein